jgi:type II secretion system protein G
MSVPARKSLGFTLIELLIVVAIIGIIAAIAIPNLLNAIQRGKQKRTMGDLRTTATANESYSIDNNQYIVLTNTVGGLTAYLQPTYVKKVPQKDGWNSDVRYDSPGQEYTITSYGKDKAAGNNQNVGANGGTSDFRADIVFSTGSFVQFPDGTQN